MPTNMNQNERWDCPRLDTGWTGVSRTVGGRTPNGRELPTSPRRRRERVPLDAVSLPRYVDGRGGPSPPLGQWCGRSRGSIACADDVRGGASSVSSLFSKHTDCGQYARTRCSEYFTPSEVTHGIGSRSVVVTLSSQVTLIVDGPNQVVHSETASKQLIRNGAIPPWN